MKILFKLENLNRKSIWSFFVCKCKKWKARVDKCNQSSYVITRAARVEFFQKWKKWNKWKVCNQNFSTRKSVCNAKVHFSLTPARDGKMSGPARPRPNRAGPGVKIRVRPSRPNFSGKSFFSFWNWAVSPAENLARSQLFLEVKF